jgi:hypothetical protein
MYVEKRKNLALTATGPPTDGGNNNNSALLSLCFDHETNTCKHFFSKEKRCNNKKNKSKMLV